MAYYKSLLAVFLIIGLAGCATIKGDFESASKQDTIWAYELFLRNHPNSEFNKQANARLKELRQIKAEEEKREAEARLKQLETERQRLEEKKRQLSEYQVGKLKRNEFRAQWSFTAGSELGIVGISSYNHVITYYMGSSMMESVTRSRGLPSDEIGKYLINSIEDLEAKALRGETVKTSGNDAIVLCQLVFKDEVLYTNDCR